MFSEDILRQWVGDLVLIISEKVFDSVECLTHIHETGEDVGAIAVEV